MGSWIQVFSVNDAYDIDTEVSLKKIKVPFVIFEAGQEGLIWKRQYNLTKESQNGEVKYVMLSVNKSPKSQISLYRVVNVMDSEVL